MVLALGEYALFHITLHEIRECENVVGFIKTLTHSTNTDSSLPNSTPFEYLLSFCLTRNGDAISSKVILKFIFIQNNCSSLFHCGILQCHNIFSIHIYQVDIGFIKKYQAKIFVDILHDP